MARMGTKVRRATNSSRFIHLLVPLFVILTLAAAASAETIGPAEITLHHHRYYEWWGDDGLTMLGYKVKATGRHPVDAWIIGLGECFQPEDILWWSDFEWADEPIRGLRFYPSSKTEIFYFYVLGPCEMGSTPIVVSNEGELYYGIGEGPVCGGPAVSLSVVSGADVSFPPINGHGRFDALQITTLRVSSTVAGWTLDHAVSVSIPEGADEQTVRDVFRPEVEQTTGGAGTSDIHVSYTLEIEEEDFNGLPQGSYVIRITYTMSADL